MCLRFCGWRRQVLQYKRKCGELEEQCRGYSDLDRQARSKTTVSSLVFSWRPRGTVTSVTMPCQARRHWCDLDTREKSSCKYSEMMAVYLWGKLMFIVCFVTTLLDMVFGYPWFRLFLDRPQHVQMLCRRTFCLFYTLVLTVNFV